MQFESNVAHDLDKKCDQFERDWNEGDPPQISPYLAKVESAHREKLLTQLIALDMEFRLRHQNSAQVSTLEDYLADFASDLSKSSITNLAVKEFRYRQQWGDRPMIHDFLNRFPDYSTDLQKPLRDYLAQVTTTTVGIYRNETLQHEMRLMQPLIIGRQGKEDPSPITSLSTKSHDRLIVAHTSNRVFSRKQIRVEIVQKGGILIQNCSQHPIRVELSNPLAPHASIVVHDPLVMKLNEIAVRVAPA